MRYANQRVLAILVAAYAFLACHVFCGCFVGDVSKRILTDRTRTAYQTQPHLARELRNDIIHAESPDVVLYMAENYYGIDATHCALGLAVLGRMCGRNKKLDEKLDRRLQGFVKRLKREMLKNLEGVQSDVAFAQAVVNIARGIGDLKHLAPDLKYSFSEDFAQLAVVDIERIQKAGSQYLTGIVYGLRHVKGIPDVDELFVSVA